MKIHEDYGTVEVPIQQEPQFTYTLRLLQELYPDDRVYGLDLVKGYFAVAIDDKTDVEYEICWPNVDWSIEDTTCKEHCDWDDFQYRML